MVEGFKSINTVGEFLTADIRAAKDLGYNTAEYQWVKGQILAASTNPTEIVQAWGWMQQHPGLQGEPLADAVDPQPWDPSVKALTQFPSVLANMDKNVSWTSALGDAYFNDQQDVINAIQALRKRAQDAGTLKTTTQQKVTTQGQTIIIEPPNPEIVGSLQ